MSLSIDSIKRAKEQAKTTSKPVKVSVGDGIRLYITKKSSVFQLRYRIKDSNGKPKEKILTLNKLVAKTQPTLAKAITKALETAEQAKELIQQGIDPSKEKQISKASETVKQELTLNLYFEHWIKRISKAAEWSKKHNRDMKSKFDLHISPLIGSLPLHRIDRQQITKVLDELIVKPATYKKARSLLNMLLEDAVTTNKIEFNPVPRGRVSAVSKYKVKKLPAITDLHRLQNLIAGIKRVNISPEVRTASLLQAYTALRSQTVIAAKWSEFDLTLGLWKIPRLKGRMKLSDQDKYGEYFTVPLSSEVIALLQEWRSTLRWQNSDLLFPSNSQTGHITIEALTKVYKLRLNTDEHCAHGWRSSFSTLAHEAISEDGKGQFRTDVIERCLDHVVGNEVTQAYNRGELLELRHSLMCWWGVQISSTNLIEINAQTRREV